MESKGQTIIEAVVALSAILVAVVSITMVVTTTLHNSSFIQNQNEASKYAQQGIEFLRAANENNTPLVLQGSSPGPLVSQLSSGSTATYCFNQDTSLASGTGPNCPVGSNGFKRSVSVTRGTCAQGVIFSGEKVAVSAYWSGSDCSSADTFCHESTLVTCLGDNGESAP